MSTLELDDCIIRNPDLVATEMDGDLVMMSIERGEYYGLNAVASRIWELLEAPMRVKELCNQLTREFEVDGEQCRLEVMTFVNELFENEMIRRTDQDEKTSAKR